MSAKSEMYPLKRRIDTSLEDYDRLREAHETTMKHIRETYKGDHRFNQEQSENEKYAAALASVADAHNAVVPDVVNRLISKVNRKLSAPVSEDALNTLQLLRMRDNVSAAEIEAFVDRYSDNYGIMSALEEIAQSGKKSGKPGIADALKSIDKGDSVTVTGAITMLKNMLSYSNQMAAAISMDRGQLAVAVSHNLVTQQSVGLEPVLDKLESFRE
jgi:hypothetical protein